MKITVDVNHCYDFNCKYLKKETIYPADSFEMPYNAAECTHSDAREASNFHPCLGCDDDYPYDDYCKIPKWCPLLVNKE